MTGELVGLAIGGALVVGFLLGRRTHQAVLGAALTVQHVSASASDAVLSAAREHGEVGKSLEAMRSTIEVQGRFIDGQGRVIQSLIEELREFRHLTTRGGFGAAAPQVGEDTDPYRVANRAIAAHRATDGAVP